MVERAVALIQIQEPLLLRKAELDGPLTLILKCEWNGMRARTLG